ncbi:hypothetical protein Patl1_21612 [Pistacia atlantica]|uniref:Uncharacterized protein n=1 Tax=Pistacia atlantica TaxID=434234 RepID=A0ACC1BIH0_9ROSI|nr:hypothetical protein Patl1_21612 [Pistacia atlantica]
MQHKYISLGPDLMQFHSFHVQPNTCKQGKPQSTVSCIKQHEIIHSLNKQSKKKKSLDFWKSLKETTHKKKF